MAKIMDIPERPLRRTYSAAEIREMDIPRPEYLVQDLIPEKGTAILVAASAIGKSWACLDIALAVATGGHALGHFWTQPGPVLYLAYEDAMDRIKDRLDRYNRAFPDELRFWAIDSETIHNPELIEPEFPFGEFMFQDATAKADLAALIATYKPVLIIFDTFGHATGPLAKGVNEYQFYVPLIQSFRKLALISKCAMLFTHHTKKGEVTGDWMEKALGSTGIMATFDSRMCIQRARNESNATLYITGKGVPEQELALHYEKESCEWSVVGDSRELKMNEARQKVIVLLGKNPKGLTADDFVTEGVYGNRITAKNNLNSMVNYKIISRSGDEPGEGGKQKRYFALQYRPLEKEPVARSQGSEPLSEQEASPAPPIGQPQSIGRKQAATGATGIRPTADLVAISGPHASKTSSDRATGQFSLHDDPVYQKLMDAIHGEEAQNYKEYAKEEERQTTRAFTPMTKEEKEQIRHEIEGE